MITEEMIDSLKRNDVSKNHVLTKERIKATWDVMSKEEKLKLTKYGITRTSVDRTRNFGSISVKLAAAIALVTGTNPFYLTAEDDANTNEADEDSIRQFVTQHGQGKALTGDIKPKRSAKKIDKSESEPDIVEPSIIDEPTKKVMPLEEYARLQLEIITPKKLDALNSITNDDITVLLENLTTQAKYSEDANDLLRLLRLILIR